MSVYTILVKSCGFFFTLLEVLLIFFYSGINEDHLRLGEIIEMIHTSSLVHDDVLDEAELRRGI